MQVRTIVVEDSREFSLFLMRYLESELDLPIEVVGRALDGDQALDLVRRTEPDLVLMDISMPSMSGLDAARSIRAVDLSPKIVMLTVHEEAEYRRAAADAGADAYVSKSAIYRTLGPTLEGLFPGFDDAHEE